jgi:hypothetical protein
MENNGKEGKELAIQASKKGQLWERVSPFGKDVNGAHTAV